MELHPSLKHQDKPSKGFSPAKKLFTMLFIGSLGLNGYLLYFQKDKIKSHLTIQEPTVQTAVAKKIEAPTATKPAATILQSESSAPAELKQVSLPGAVSLNGKEVHFLSLKIENSLNYSVCKALPGKDCERMSAYISRTLAWFLDMRTSMRNGDSLSLIYEVLPTEEHYKVLKMSYTSGYANKTYEVNYYKGPDMKYGAYYNPEGLEVAPRIEENQTPIKDYIEITSLPGEFREGKVHGHSGTDFKADSGTPVYSAFDGKVIRVNWNFKMNGDCVEVEHADKGVRTLYLHLSKVLIKPGTMVKQGQQIAESGNTGRSFAPHLHYEIQSLDKKKAIFSPFKSKFHQTYFKDLPSEDKVDYEKTVRLYNSILQKS